MATMAPAQAGKQNNISP